MNSAGQVLDSYTPEEAVSLQEFWKSHGGTQDITDPQNKFANLFTGKIDKIKNEYQTYLDNLNLCNEARAVQSARAWDEFMSNSVYSRAFKDLERAGINPYILLNSGSTPSSTVGSSSKPNYQVSKSGIKDSQSNVKGRDIAITMLAIAKIIALMA